MFSLIPKTPIELLERDIFVLFDEKLCRIIFQYSQFEFTDEVMALLSKDDELKLRLNYPTGVAQWQS